MITETVPIEWEKSEKSNGCNACVEITETLDGGVGVRDSKHPEDPEIRVGKKTFAGVAQFVVRAAGGDTDNNTTDQTDVFTDQHNGYLAVLITPERELSMSYTNRAGEEVRVQDYTPEETLAFIGSPNTSPSVDDGGGILGGQFDRMLPDGLNGANIETASLSSGTAAQVTL